jgi:hypothetical protein
MNREDVKPFMDWAIARGLIDAQETTVERMDEITGETFLDPAWVFEPVGSLADFLKPFAGHQPAEG